MVIATEFITWRLDCGGLGERFNEPRAMLEEIASSGHHAASPQSTAPAFTSRRFADNNLVLPHCAHSPSYERSARRISSMVSAALTKAYRVGAGAGGHYFGLAFRCEGALCLFYTVIASRVAIFGNDGQTLRCRTAVSADVYGNGEDNIITPNVLCHVARMVGGEIGGSFVQKAIHIRYLIHDLPIRQALFDLSLC
jgi:hypothetical protein